MMAGHDKTAVFPLRLGAAMRKTVGVFRSLKRLAGTVLPLLCATCSLTATATGIDENGKWKSVT